MTLTGITDMEERQTIYVDIDGTLTVETEGHDYARRTPRFDVLEKIRNMYNSGHCIVLWTSRWPVDERVTREWLKRWNVRFHELKLSKPSFDLYICDKAINVEDWLNAD